MIIVNDLAEVRLRHSLAASDPCSLSSKGRLFVGKEIEVEALLLAVHVEEVVEVTCRSDIDARCCIYLPRRLNVCLFTNRCTSGDPVDRLIDIEVDVRDVVVVGSCNLVNVPIATGWTVLEGVVVPARKFLFAVWQLASWTVVVIKPAC